MIQLQIGTHISDVQWMMCFKAFTLHRARLRINRVQISKLQFGKLQLTAVLLAAVSALSLSSQGEPKPSPKSAALQEFQSCSASTVKDDDVAAAIANDVSSGSPTAVCAPTHSRPLAGPANTDFVSSMYQIHKQTSGLVTTNQIITDVSKKSQDAEKKKKALLEGAKQEFQTYAKSLTGSVEKKLGELPKTIDRLKKTDGKKAAAELQSRLTAMNELCSFMQRERANKKTASEIAPFEKARDSLITTKLLDIARDESFQLLAASPKLRLKYLPDSGAKAIENCKKGRPAYTFTEEKVAPVSGGMGLTITREEKLVSLTDNDFKEAVQDLEVIYKNRKSDLLETKKLLTQVKSLPLDQQLEKTRESMGNLVGFYPLAVAETLQSSSAKNYGRFACNALQTFIDRKDFQENLSLVMMGAGLVSLPLSFVIPGSGVGLLAAGLSVASLASGYSSYQYYGEQAEGFRGGLAMSLVSPSLGEGQITEAEEKRAQELLGILMAVGGSANDIKALQTLLKGKTALTAATQVKGSALTAVEEALIRENPKLSY
ncbi:MAG: hypothetical protein EOP09_07575, partial [Proteobacteria bacterium]